MSRALRRQPLVQKPPAKPAPFRSGSRPVRKQEAASAAAAAAASSKHTPFYLRPIPHAIRKFVGDIINELKKVTWPTREETTRLTVAVVAVSVAIGLGLGGVDIGFNWFVDHTLLR
jgi:preprotein translocase subunit SecE